MPLHFPKICDIGGSQMEANSNIQPTRGAFGISWTYPSPRIPAANEGLGTHEPGCDWNPG